jgi:hypothetical protein
MVVGFTTTCAIRAYHQRCEFEPCSWRVIVDTTSCDKACQWLATGRWFSLDTPVSSTNKSHRHNITENSAESAALNTIILTLSLTFYYYTFNICQFFLIVDLSTKLNRSFYYWYIFLLTATREMEQSQWLLFCMSLL